MNHILVTGGTGYIGSHAVVELIQAGYAVEILDNLSNSKLSVLDGIERITGTRPPFHQMDLRDAAALDHLFATHHFDLVMHFAGLKAVAESVERPLDYYSNNVTGTINLLLAMLAHHSLQLIFSSSATVYGTQPSPQYVETMPTGANLANPYGRTKHMIETIIQDVCAAHPDFSAVLLRYFNPIGAHPSGLIGEDPNGRPNNLMPIIMQVATGRLPALSIYGDDYPTPDGTCIRDYIHVVDLAKGHLAAMKAFALQPAEPAPATPTSAKTATPAPAKTTTSAKTATPTSAKTPTSAPIPPNLHIYNLGSGHGTSVKELVSAFNAASGTALPVKIAPRRAGDLAEFYADPTLAKRELGWQTSLTIADAMRDTLNFLHQ